MIHFDLIVFVPIVLLKSCRESFVLAEDGCAAGGILPKVGRVLALLLRHAAVELIVSAAIESRRSGDA